MSANPHSKDEQELQQLEGSWDDALARRDAAAVFNLIADDYQVTGINGEIRNKTKVLEAMASTNPQLKPYRRDDVDVRIDGDKAVITGRIIWRGSNCKPDCTNGDCHARYLKVYEKRADKWQVVVAKATRI
ncbi:MAG TPA: nuclear transport factor 2 family protein [Pyrinomonadaceae bacterium]|nr:nuclear transport factor 2 family protein [Pyrinomonadaceae bacterium]